VTEKEDHFWIKVAQQIQAIAQSGLTYSEGKYDIDRYGQLKEISVQMVQHYTGEDYRKIKNLFTKEAGYKTPKVDVRGVVFKDNKILMVKESVDGKWSLPGGWADVCLSPFENAKKEIWEEAGLTVEPVRILAIFDKMKHDHPPDIYHTYKLFILCKNISGELKTGIETTAVDYFAENELPEMSLERNIPSQVKQMFRYLEDPLRSTYCE
jgi:ADP-ribose pyrophosphatase YjhB (NUDIX family)